MGKGSMVPALILLCSLFVLSGCSFSDSSYSSSSPSRSSSQSSGGSVEQSQALGSSYREEVASLAVIYVGSQGTSQDFHRDLTQVSNRHGIIDWGNDQGTFLAIGQGIKRANVPVNSIQYLSFLHGIKSLPLYNSIYKGYNGQ
ncbi:MAG: putative lipoprotein [Thermodesulfobacteriota bacterium]